MLPLDLKRLEFILKSWVRLHVVKIVSSVDLVKALKMASYHRPLTCIKQYFYVLFPGAVLVTWIQEKVVQ